MADLRGLIAIGIPLVLAACGGNSTSAESTPTTAAHPSVPTLSTSPTGSTSPANTANPRQGCPATIPEPSGQGAHGEFVPAQPAAVVICRYSLRAPGWALAGFTTLTRTEAIKLASALNHAKPAPTPLKCPPPIAPEAWLFSQNPSVVVKAGWCNVIVGQNRAVQAPRNS